MNTTLRELSLAHLSVLDATPPELATVTLPMPRCTQMDGWSRRYTTGAGLESRHRRNDLPEFRKMIVDLLRRTNSNYLILLAEWTGLEPATPGVTGRYSNQLNYHSSNCSCELHGGC